MRFIFQILLFLIAFSATAQEVVELPDPTTLDSSRIIKKLVPGETVRRIQFVYISSKGDTTRTRLFDSLTTISKIRESIFQQNNLSANNTYLLYQQFSKAKGVGIYGKLHKRISGQDYTDYTWSVLKTMALGTWQFSGVGITTHLFAVDENANAARTQGTPNYSGKIRIHSDNRVELVNYIPGKPSIVLDFVTRQEVVSGGQKITQNVFMSTDGQYFAVK